MKYLVLFLLLVPLVSAGASVSVSENGVVYVEEEVVVVDGVLLFSLPDSSYLKVSLDDEDLSYSINGGVVYLEDFSDGVVFVNYISDVLTDKNEGVWSFNFSSSSSIVEIELPKGVNLLAVVPTTSVFEGEFVSLNFELDEGETIFLKYNYDIFVNEENNDFFIDMYKYLFGVFFVLVIFVLMSSFLKKERKSSVSRRMTSGKEDILKTLIDVQRKIVVCLLNHGDLTQAKIRSLTGLPKSTLSRNLKYLEGKQVLEIKGVGTSNLVCLSKWFKDK